ncbi:hypothetical protein ACLOAV_005462 [Pseudogymnoascus australis]
MEILALGLPRSGTDSLRTALLALHYPRIWHGFDLPSTRPNDCAIWVPLLKAKVRGDDRPGREFDWDVLLGDCAGVMDMPPGIFAEELLDFYPGAKVVLNRRRDMDAWHRSLNGAAEMVLGSWGVWGLSWWDAELFWWYRSAVLWMGIMGEGKGGFKQNGKEWAEKYYERLEEKLKGEGREYLDWEVQDGWGPLCEFLGKEVPDEDFPWGNKGGDEFEKNANKALEKMVKRAVFRIAGTVVVFAAGVGGWWWRSR